MQICLWLGEYQSTNIKTNYYTNRLFSVNMKFLQRQARSSITKSETPSSTSCRRKTTSHAASSALHRKSSTFTSCASSQRCHKVRSKNFRCKQNFLKLIFFLFFPDVRGMPQEVSVTVKKGVETKSYEGVSVKLKFEAN